MILADTNVWIDMVQRDPVWLEWSVGELMKARSKGVLAVNAVVLAELAAAFDSVQELRSFIASSQAQTMPLTDNAAFLAGRAFLKYRENKGNKTGVLPDFFIGAHAMAEGWTLLTRDKARYATYFPKVKLICP